MGARQFPLPTRPWGRVLKGYSCKRSHFWGCPHADGHGPCNGSPGCQLSHCLFLLCPGFWCTAWNPGWLQGLWTQEPEGLRPQHPGFLSPSASFRCRGLLPSPGYQQHH